MKFGTSVPKFLGRNKDSSRRNFVADRFYYFGILNSPSRRASCGIRRSVCRRPSVGRCPSSVIVILILRRLASCRLSSCRASSVLRLASVWRRVIRHMSSSVSRRRIFCRSVCRPWFFIVSSVVVSLVSGLLLSCRLASCRS